MAVKEKPSLNGHAQVITETSALNSKRFPDMQATIKQIIASAGDEGITVGGIYDKLLEVYPEFNSKTGAANYHLNNLSKRKMIYKDEPTNKRDSNWHIGRRPPSGTRRSEVTRTPAPVATTRDQRMLVMQIDRVQRELDDLRKIVAELA